MNEFDLRLGATGFWMAFVPAALLAWPIYRLLVRWKSQQTVSQYAPEGHQVKQGTPTMGGLVIILSLLIAIGGMVLSGRPHDWFGPALLLAFGFGLIGFIDDYVVPRMVKGSRGLGWKQKILMQFVFALAAAWWIFGDFGAYTWITFFVILFFANAYNFSDGLDALAGTLLLGLAGAFGFIALITGYDQTTVVLMAMLCGAVVPFLFLNAPPAKLFMGDVGSLPIGALLGASASVLLLKAPHAETGLFQAIAGNWPVLAAVKIASLVMAIELLPVPLQIFWVKAFKKRLFPYTPIHHAFEKAGWKETRVVAMFALTQLLLSAIAVSIVAYA